MRIKTCPSCGSTDIRLDPLMGITGTRFRCNTCNYSGDIIAEHETEKKFRK